jgi:SagB-type dehydrogenase family enzyme
LTQTLSAREGVAVGEQLAATLQALGDRGWLQYGVLPLAIAEPLADSPTLDLDIPHWSQANVSLSRFAYQRSHGGGMVLESPLSKFRIKLTDWRASALLAQLAQPQPLRRLTPPPQIGPETAYQFLNLLWATGFLSVEAEAPELQLWEFHNLLFHSRSRQGRHDYPTGDIAASVGVWDQFPVVKPPLGGAIVPLAQFSIDAIRQRDKTLTTALEKRQSMREYDDHRPITLEQLGEFLYRTARVKEVYSLEAEQQALIKAEFGEAIDWGEVSRRPYPCGGAMYELEIYPVVRHCAGVNPGLYHYDPLNHHLVQVEAAEADIQALLQDAHQSSGAQGVPQVLLIITARFGRLFRKYRSLAYALVLKHVGVLYENFYLVATNMDLAPCALGAGDSDRFAQATGLDYIVESSVGEFMLGSRANRDLDPSAIGHPPLEQAVASEATVEPMEDIDMALSSDEPDQAASATAIAPPTSPAPLPPVSPSPLPPVSLHPHDLDDRLSGLADLRNHTLGDPRITIVILDGNPDHSLSCFAGAEISKVFPYWHPPAEPVPQEVYLKFQEIDNYDTLDKDQKTEAIKAAFPEGLLQRIHGDNHACHITSTIVGQEDTPAPGLAPRCRVINVPLNTSRDTEEFISPLNLARAFELALDLGANIIHCAACRPTQTGEGEEILVQALQKCLDQNILIVAPAGNNEGECWCMPATLPGVLSVGALKPDGTPYKFSNWGGNNALEGIMAPGGEILGAQPANEAPVRLKGTSMAAPVMTGLCGLLMSRQLQQGKPLDAEAIRAALLNTALPCTPADTDQPERCLRGKVNLPSAMEILFGPSLTITFSGDQVTRQEHGAIAPSGVSSQEPEVSSQTLDPASPLLPSSTITPSTAHSGHVYALGTIAYDFGDETRRDTFQQAMSPVNRDGLLLPPDPYDARQMVDHLDHHPDQAPDLIWTLQLDGNTLYALDPKGPFAPATYEMFLLMLNGQLALPTSGEFIDHISLPGKRTDRTVTLLSGEEVPVLKVLNPRGMYGWNVPTLVEAALATVTTPEGETALLREGLTAFLQRVYHDLRNEGQTSRDRALNFAVTNTFQAAATFAEAIADRRQLDTIEVEKSPYCRLNSDCWDVLLTFYDPEDGKRSRQVFRFTLDVADTMPVTVGRIKRWAKPGKGGQAAVDH